jgi:predicted nuclease of restriction endonuclease-like (RecB) superfamily
MKTKLPSSREYAEFVTELKTRIQSARISAARAVNRDLILLYWNIGRGILERQAHLGWGKAVVETLAKDLTKEFPSTNSFSPDNLWRMRQLYAAYTEAEFLGQLVPETASERGSAEILGQPVPDLRCQALSENSAHGEILLRGLS